MRDEAAPETKLNPQKSDLSSWAAPVTAVVAVAGVAWYGLLSFCAAIVYDPLGVQPREVGLSSGAVLADLPGDLVNR
jgi:hypothetical protein